MVEQVLELYWQQPGHGRASYSPRADTAPGEEHERRNGTVRRGMRGLPAEALAQVGMGPQKQMGEVLLDDLGLVNSESGTKEANYGVG